MAAENARSQLQSDSLRTARELERSKEIEKYKREVKNALVGEQVLHELGQPRDLLKVQVRPLWDNTYRVNVFVGVSPASARIANSFFVVTDGDCNILESTPRILRQHLPNGKSPTGERNVATDAIA
jgi:hypothetical protein